MGFVLSMPNTQYNQFSSCLFDIVCAYSIWIAWNRLQVFSSLPLSLSHFEIELSPIDIESIRFTPTIFLICFPSIDKRYMHKLDKIKSNQKSIYEIDKNQSRNANEMGIKMKCDSMSTTYSSLLLLLTVLTNILSNWYWFTLQRKKKCSIIGTE